MKYFFNNSMVISFSFIDFIGDKASMILTPMQKKVVLVAMLIFSVCTFVYSYSYCFQTREIEEIEDESIAIKQHKTIAERLAKNCRDAVEQQLKEETKNFKIKEGPVPSSIKIWANSEECERKIFEEFSLSHTLYAGVAFCQGYRETMEDAHMLKQEESFKIKDKKYSFTIFGICDGHGGYQASNFVQQNFRIYLKKALQNNNQEELTDEGIFKAFKECFQQLDADYTGLDGTTATVAVILNDKIWVANVGDSRTILVKDGQVIQASEDAKPSMKRYKKTIEKLGGMVIRNRVNGILGVARAIGDKHVVGARGEEEQKAKCCVSPNPKITCYSLADFKGGCLVLACDGLYDVATTNEVGRAIQEMDQKELPDEMSRRLVFNAINHGSMDNVSVMVVQLFYDK